MANSKHAPQPDFVLFADEFAQPMGSLRASARALWIELQEGWNAHRAAAQRRRAIADGHAVHGHGVQCSTLPQWQNR